MSFMKLFGVEDRNYNDRHKAFKRRKLPNALFLEKLQEKFKELKK